MTPRALSTITLIFAILTAIAQLDLHGLISLLPGGSEQTVSNVTGGIATLLILTRTIGDFLDDGQVNGSFGKEKPAADGPRTYCHPLTVAAACLIALVTAGLTSCAGLTLSASTPWGDVSSTDGHTTVIARPIVIPSGK